MGIRFHCHHCQTKLNIKSELAGKRAICPDCDGRFRIPLQSQNFSDSLNGNSAKRPVTNSPASTSAANGPKLADLKSHKAKTTSEAMYLVRPPSGGIYGPADLATIRQWVTQKRVTADTYLAPVGSNDWQSAPSVLPQSFAKG